MRMRLRAGRWRETEVSSLFSPRLSFANVERETFYSMGIGKAAAGSTPSRPPHSKGFNSPFPKTDQSAVSPDLQLHCREVHFNMAPYAAIRSSLTPCNYQTRRGPHVMLRRCCLDGPEERFF